MVAIILNILKNTFYMASS